MKRHYAIYTALLFVVLAGSALGQNGHSGSASTYFDATQLLKDIQTLSADDMEGRSADRPAMAKAREYVEKRLKESGVEQIGDSFKQEFEFKLRGSGQTLKGVNYYGQIKGKKSPDKFIVITAHYDHDGLKNGEIYNGADDNASGTAALFAVASYFKKHQPDHSLIFAAFDAEEKGLVGSRHFVANLPVPKESIVLNVNMDMIARNDKNELYASGTYSYPQFRQVLEKVQKAAKVKLILGHDDPKTGHDDWTFQSDQGAFHAAKIPFIYFGVEDHEDYHKPTDDYGRIHPAFYVKSVETIIEALREVDRTGANSK